MTVAAFPSTPAVHPGELDEILAEFAEHNVRPTWCNVIAAALDRGLPEDFAAALADAAQRIEHAT